MVFILFFSLWMSIKKAPLVPTNHLQVYSVHWHTVVQTVSFTANYLYVMSTNQINSNQLKSVLSYEFFHISKIVLWKFLLLLSLSLMTPLCFLCKDLWFVILHRVHVVYILVFSMCTSFEQDSFEIHLNSQIYFNRSRKTCHSGRTRWHRGRSHVTENVHRRRLGWADLWRQHRQLYADFWSSIRRHIPHWFHDCYVHGHRFS